MLHVVDCIVYLGGIHNCLAVTQISVGDARVQSNQRHVEGLQCGVVFTPPVPVPSYRWNSITLLGRGGGEHSGCLGNSLPEGESARAAHSECIWERATTKSQEACRHLGRGRNAREF